jgi:hypothetical protein
MKPVEIVLRRGTVGGRWGTMEVVNPTKVCFKRVNITIHPPVQLLKNHKKYFLKYAIF